MAGIPGNPERFRSLEDAFGSAASLDNSIAVRKTPSLRDSPSNATARAKSVNREREEGYQVNRRYMDLVRLDKARESAEEDPTILPVISEYHVQPDNCGLDIWHHHKIADGGSDRFNFEWSKPGSMLKAAINPYRNGSKLPPLNILHLVGWALNNLVNKRGTITQIEAEIIHEFPACNANSTRNLLRARIDKFFMEEEGNYNKIFRLASETHQPQTSLAKRDMVWELPPRELDYIFAEFYGANLSVGVEAPSVSLRQRRTLFNLPHELLVPILEEQLRIGKDVLVDREIMNPQVPSHVFFDDKKRGRPVQLASSGVLAIAEACDEKFRSVVHQAFFKVNIFWFPNVKVLIRWLEWIGPGNRSFLHSVIVRLSPQTETQKDTKRAFDLLGESRSLEYLEIRLVWSPWHTLRQRSWLTETSWFASLEDLCLKGAKDFKYIPDDDLVYNDPVYGGHADWFDQQERVLKSFACRVSDPRSTNEPVLRVGSGRNHRIQIAKDSPTDLDHATLKRWAKDFRLPKSHLDTFSDADLAQYIARC